MGAAPRDGGVIMDAQNSTSTEIALIKMPTELSTVFASDEMIDVLLRQIEARVDEHQPDLTTAKGRDAIKSLAYAVSRSKTALIDAAKKLTEDAEAQIKAVRKQRQTVEQRLDELRDKARQPLTEWETAEETRKRALAARLSKFDPANTEDAGRSAFSLAEWLACVVEEPIDDTWQEFKEQAELRRGRLVAQLTTMHAAAVQREQQEAELAALRAEAEARRVADEQRAAEERAARAAADAAAAAQREAERRAEDAERERAEAQRREVELAEAAARAAERAAERAKADAAEAARVAAEKAEADKAAAVEAERQRAQREREDAERSEALRQKNREHVGAIRREAKEALMKIEGVSEQIAVQIVLAIHADTIPHVSIKY